MAPYQDSPHALQQVFGGFLFDDQVLYHTQYLEKAYETKASVFTHLRRATKGTGRGRMARGGKPDLYSMV